MKKQMNITLRLLLILICYMPFSIFAQIPPSPNCPPPSLSDSVVITGSNTVSCGNPVVLTAVGFSALPGTTTYSVSNPAYSSYPYIGANTPITSTNQSINTVDDEWSQAVALPFSFCFFGNKFDSILVGSNGNVSFNTANTGTFNQYNFQTVTMPNNNPTWNNSICGPHSDIDPSDPGASITWQLYGTAPCRAMVVSYDSVEYFGCTGNRTSQQIVLYENTNIIDMNIKYKQLCATNGSNGGTAHQGIQDATGSVAFTVPGHNGGQWTDSLSTWRFTPNAAPANSFTYTWFNANTGAVVGTGSTISVAPTTTTTYYVLANTGCSGINYVDSFTVALDTPVIANFTGDIHLGCENDTILFTNMSLNGQDFFWSFGDLDTSILTSPTHVYQNQGIYNVTLIASYNNTCFDTITKSFNLNHPIQAAFATNYSLPPALDSLCVGSPITINNFSLGGGLIHSFDMGDGTTIVKNNNAPFNYTYAAAGVYVIKLTITDTLGCIDTFSRSMYVDNQPYADISLSDSIICLGEPIYFKDTVAPFIKSFSYDFGDNKEIKNIHNPVHTYETSGNFTVTFTGDFLICPDLVFNKTIDVTSFPLVNLGPDSAICPGLTGNITLAPLNTNAENYLWSTGDTLKNIIVSNSGLYWLRAGNKDCYTSDTLLVKNDCYTNIPNIFAPDGDNPANHYFFPTSILQSGATSFEITIYNRWGETVFNSNNINSNGWDGKFGGKPQPMGVYVYNINVVYKNGLVKRYTGNVTLLR